jgi:Restriction Endonuclease associating with ARP
MRKQIENFFCKQNNLTATYFKSPLENVLPFIHPNWGKIKANLSQGSGNELQSGKFNSIGSSSALGVNAFGVFYEPNFMTWPTIESEKFTNPTFEKKLSNGLHGTNPNLDVFFENDKCVLAIECKFLETLGKKKPKFSDQYLNVKDERRDSKWFQLMLKIINGNVTFKYLDATQLIKHYFGLTHEYAESDLDLEIGYIFWEPDGNVDLPGSVIDLYVEHRNECERFAELVVGDKIRFSFYSYFELIEFWRGNEIGTDDALIMHFELFEKKYKV